MTVGTFQGGAVATVQQEMSADAEVLGVMTSHVTKGHSSDGAEAGRRAGLAPRTQKCALGSRGGPSWGSGLLLGMGSETATLLLGTPSPGVLLRGGGNQRRAPAPC